MRRAPTEDPTGPSLLGDGVPPERDGYWLFESRSARKLFEKFAEYCYRLRRPWGIDGQTKQSYDDKTEAEKRAREIKGGASPLGPVR